jgi:acyl-ACP thioesterase
MYPIRDENITIKTWAKEPDGLFAYRDFEVLNEQNEVIAVASSAWLILDINSRRPHRLDAFKKDFPIVRENVMASAPEKLPPVEVTQKNGPIRIAVSDIDFNGHTNNASYIRWILDSLPIEWHRENLTKEVEVNFLHESTTEQHYIVGKQDIDNDTSLFSISRQEDGKELVRVKLTSSRI